MSVSTFDKVMQAAGPLMARRANEPAGKLTDVERTTLQEATLGLVSELRSGRSSDEIQSLLVTAGWQPEVAKGFISLVNQLLAKMYRQRMFIFAGVSVFTSMIASMAVPQAAQNEFPWWAAALSTLIALVSVGCTVRHWQLYRRHRQIQP
jgi:hypothetical protein